MEKDVFSKKHIEFLRAQFGRIDKVLPEEFHARMERLFKPMTSDMICQLARAQIKWLSREAWIEAKHRGITIEGLKFSEGNQ